MDRRSILTAALAASGALAARAAHAYDRWDEDPTLSDVLETQRGDPEIPSETVKFNPYRIQAFSAQSRAAFEPRLPNFASTYLSTAQEFLGVSRQSNRRQVSDFLEVFDLPFQINGKPLAFCASGLSYVAALAYARARTGKRAFNRQSVFPALQTSFGDIDHHHFYPTPSVKDMYYVALGKRRWVPRRLGKLPKPGWLVIYDWSKNGGADHVGLVERVGPDGLHTIEFNTSGKIGNSQINGGTVSRKTRALNETVKGYIRTDIKSVV